MHQSRSAKLDTRITVNTKLQTLSWSDASSHNPCQRSPMGRNRRRGWVSRLVGVIASVVAICCSCVTSTEASPGDGVSSSVGVEAAATQWGTKPPPHTCPSVATPDNHFLLLVSTIDGSVSALDMRTDGEILWSVRGDDRPLLSSSITNIQVERHGLQTRLIPSLDGGLYEFNGEDLNAIPMTAESLLSSSVRITDNCVMVGGKEVGSYGVDIKTGQMVYQCTSVGCKETSEAGGVEGDMLVITRNMQTVRAVDVNSGLEKWNFSVGQHDVLFVTSKKAKPGLEHEDATNEVDDEDVTLVNCMPSEDEMDLEEEEQLKRRLRVVVSNGLVVSLNPDDPNQMSWSHKFASPVAKAWILHRGKLENINLFDSKVVPSLSSSHPFQPFRGNRDEPVLYLGTHKRQLYVLKQDPDPDSCDKELPWIRNKSPGQDAMAPVPRVTWRPYLSAAGFHTPLFGGNKPPKIPLLGQNEDSEGLHDPEHNPDVSTKSLTIWHDHYPFDVGYYLYPEYTEKQTRPKWELPPAEEEGIMDVLPASLWMWWKEVVAISLLTSLLVHVILTRFIHRPMITEGSSPSLNKMDSSDSLQSSDSSPTLGEDKQTPAEFKSRFADEFDCIACLGKGGYGIVFHVRNKVDDQEYAVKRIALPNSDGAIKQKMLREVRTLAKLDHIGIVRYFHSWMEDPPPGWQEERDREFSHTLGGGDCMSPTMDSSMPSTDLTHKSLSSSIPHSSAKQENPLRQRPSLLADIMPCAAGDLDCEPLTHNATGSGEFSVHSDAEWSTDESGSFSLGGDEHKDLECEESKNSLSVVFRNSDDAESSVSREGMGDASCSGHPVIPFQHFTTEENRSKFAISGSDAGLDPQEDSYSIVFEDSQGSNSKDHSSLCDQSKSVAFADSSYGGSMGDTGSSDNLRNGQHTVDFTLSSHDNTEHGAGEEEEKKRKDKVKKEKAVVPKLYLYLQMQLCRRESLKDWLMANTLNRERGVILDFFEQIVSAVDYVHSKGLIHRDLKPSNIFFALDGTVKVGDFGLVTAAENLPENSDQSPASKASAKHTAEVGTQLYMSPEQVQKKPYDQKVDIFSLGMIFLELMMPFSTGMERIATLQSARKGVFPERFCRELSAESELVRQLMSADPQERPTTEQVLEHSLLQDFSSRTSSRFRTISSSSSHSDPILHSDL